MKSFSGRLWAIMLFLSLGFVSMTAVADDDDREGPTILDIVLQTKGAEALVAAVLLVDASGELQALLDQKGKRLVLLAPSNAAFQKLFEELLMVPPGTKTLDELFKEVAKLPGAADLIQETLLKHVTKPKKRLKLRNVSETALLRKGEIMTFDECVRPVGVGGSGVEINQQSTIIKANVWARNGVIHFIDTVITEDDSFCPSP